MSASQITTVRGLGHSVAAYAPILCIENFATFGGPSVERVFLPYEILREKCILCRSAQRQCCDINCDVSRIAQQEPLATSIGYLPR